MTYTLCELWVFIILAAVLLAKHIYANWNIRDAPEKRSTLGERFIIKLDRCIRDSPSLLAAVYTSPAACIRASTEGFQVLLCFEVDQLYARDESAECGAAAAAAAQTSGVFNLRFWANFVYPLSHVLRIRRDSVERAELHALIFIGRRAFLREASLLRSWLGVEKFVWFIRIGRCVEFIYLSWIFAECTVETGDAVNLYYQEIIQYIKVLLYIRNAGAKRSTIKCSEYLAPRSDKSVR